MQQNTHRLTGLSLTATFCDTESVQHHYIYSNLQHSSPVDYDIGSTHGLMVEQSGDQVCIPIKLYSEKKVKQFQFVLRFNADILDCSPSSCGIWTPGSAWSTSWE